MMSPMSRSPLRASLAKDPREVATAGASSDETARMVVGARSPKLTSSVFHTRPSSPESGPRGARQRRASAEIGPVPHRDRFGSGSRSARSSDSAPETGESTGTQRPSALYSLRARAVRSLCPNFLSGAETSFFTVPPARTDEAAISEFVRPRATSSATTRSPWVRIASVPSLIPFDCTTARATRGSMTIPPLMTAAVPVAVGGSSAPSCRARRPAATPWWYGPSTRCCWACSPRGSRSSSSSWCPC